MFKLLQNLKENQLSSQQNNVLIGTVLRTMGFPGNRDTPHKTQCVHNPAGWDTVQMSKQIQTSYFAQGHIA